MPKTRSHCQTCWYTWKGLVTRNTRVKFIAFYYTQRVAKGINFFTDRHSVSPTFPFLYPTQRVAEGIMFLTRPSVSPVFLVSATPLKLLNRISWNFVVIKNIMCRCAYPQEILIQFLFSGVTSYLKFGQNERYYSTLFVSATPLKPFNKIFRKLKS